jgi:hypothetical protein
MTMEIAAAALLGPASHGAQAGGAPLQVGYGVSLTDFGGFHQALQSVGARLDAAPVNPPSEAAKQLMKPFEHINGEARQLSLDARVAQANGHEMTPGEMVMLTVRCQEFMFHCQLTSNIANRTSDGLQQLFKQQG